MCELFEYICTYFLISTKKILKGFNMNRRSAKLITAGKTGGGQEKKTRNPEGVQLQHVALLFNPLRGWFLDCSLPPVSQASLGVIHFKLLMEFFNRP